MAPGGMSCGATAPGMTSSSPVENRATRGRRTTVKRAMPMLAAKPNAAGPRRQPRASTTSPRATSSPARRMCCPRLGGMLICTWVIAPLLLPPPLLLPDSPTTEHCSCITTASAPAGMGAPVKMRAAVPRAKGCPTAPAAIRCATGKVVPMFSASAVCTA